MARKQRDYSNLRESERVFDAVKLHSTHFKDYSLTHICKTAWRLDSEQSYQRLIHIFVGNEHWIGRAKPITDAVNDMADHDDDNGWFPRTVVEIKGHRGTLKIDTSLVSDECLQDHMAILTVGDNSVIVDLEELLKATRYS